MSSEEDDERVEYVRRQPNTGTSGGASEVVIHEQPNSPVEVVQTSPSVKRESVVKHTSTNTGTLVGIAVGIGVLLVGMFLVIRETPFLPYPLSIFVVVVVGLVLIGIGASLVSNRSDKP
jgi:hypothetical protein